MGPEEVMARNDKTHFVGLGLLSADILNFGIFYLL